MRYTVYVIAPQGGYPCKVGVAGNLRARLKCLQTANWEELFIHEAVLVSSKSHAFRLEGLCMKRMSESRLRGEWFNVFAEEMGKLLKELAKEIKHVLNNKVKVETSITALRL